MLTRSNGFICVFWLLISAVLVLALVPGQLGVLIPNDKVQHILAFTTLTAFAGLLWPMLNPMLLWIGLTFFGGSIELLQGLMAYGRQADWLDWLVDILTVTVTLAAIGWLKSRAHSEAAPSACPD